MLSPHFSLAELTVTDTGLPNEPNDLELGRLHTLAQELELVRAVLGGHPMHVTSGFRSEAVNKAVGGVPNSAHRLGFAADFVCPGFGDPRAVCHAIDAAAKAGRLKPDQLILEQLPNPTWTHYGRRFTSEGDPPRMQRLTKLADGSYASGIR